MSAAFALPPPPPPPPPAGMSLNAHQRASFMNLTNSDQSSATPASKSQLLIDIERGVTLKKRPEVNISTLYLTT